MKVSIIIPNYNGAKFIKDCMDSLANQTYKDFEIIVVDNNSQDNSVEYIKNNYPMVNLISLNENFGFSTAVNAGIKASNGEYVLLLNNDTKAFPDFIECLVKEIEKKPDAFSIASKMIQMYNPSLLDSAGDLYTVVGWGINRGVGRSKDLFKRPSKIFSSCAGAAIYRKSVFEKIGMFDEIHFAYLEDIDVGYRAKIYGYKNYYCPKAKIYHVGSGTSGSKYNSFKVKLAARNNIYLIYKNMPTWQLILNAPPLLLGFITKYFFFKKKGFGKDYIDALKEGFNTRHKCMRSVNNGYLIYLKIEAELIFNALYYVYDWVKRKVSEN